jgi:hypothetical protein
MVYEDVNEPIEVITVFRHGRIRPLKFKWKNRVYSITRIHGGWVSDEGYSKHYHFSVSTGGPDCFELCFDTGSMTWELTRVFMEG